MAAIPLEKQQPVEYPTSDGKPMAETTLHRVVMQDLIHGLESHFRAVPDVWVGGNLFLCYQEGNPGAALAPSEITYLREGSLAAMSGPRRTAFNSGARSSSIAE